MFCFVHLLKVPTLVDTNHGPVILEFRSFWSSMTWFFIYIFIALFLFIIFVLFSPSCSCLIWHSSRLSSILHSLLRWRERGGGSLDTISVLFCSISFHAVFSSSFFFLFFFLYIFFYIVGRSIYEIIIIGHVMQDVRSTIPTTGEAFWETKILPGYP